MEGKEIIKIEDIGKNEPEVPENPSEVTKGEGGVSLKGGAESTFKVVTSFVAKVFKKMLSGILPLFVYDSKENSTFLRCSDPA